MTNGIYAIETNDNGISYLLDIPFEKEISITWQKNINNINYRYLGEVVTDINSDIAIGGSFERLTNAYINPDDIFAKIDKQLGEIIEKDILVKIFIIEKRANTIEYLFSYPISLYRLYSEMNNVSKLIIAKLNDQALQKNNTYTSDPPGAFLYIDDQFVGETPLTLPLQVNGEHRYQIHFENYYLKDFKSELSLISNESIETQKNHFSNQNTVIIDVDKSNTKTHFRLHKHKRSGQLNLKIKDDVATDLYLGPIILKGNTRYYRGNLPIGNYYLIAKETKHTLSINETNRYKRQFQIEIKEKKKLDLEFNMTLPQTNYWKEFFFDHGRNTQIFGAISLLTGSIGAYYTLHGLSFRDQLVQARREGTLATEVYRNYLTDEAIRNETISAPLITTSILSLIFCGISYLYFTRDEAIKNREHY